MAGLTRGDVMSIGDRAAYKQATGDTISGGSDTAPVPKPEAPKPTQIASAADTTASYNAAMDANRKANEQRKQEADNYKAAQLLPRARRTSYGD